MRRTVTATGFSPSALRCFGVSIEQAKKFSSETRKDAAKAGIAMPDGSYPIFNGGDLKDAYKDYIRTGKAPAVKSHIEKRAKALGIRAPFSVT